MKIPLKKKLKHPANNRQLADQNGKDLKVGEIAENALWNTPANQGGKDYARLAMELHGKDEVDIKSEDLAIIKKAVQQSNNTLVWKAFDIAVDALEDEKEKPAEN